MATKMTPQQITVLKADINAKKSTIFASFFANPTNPEWEGVETYYKGLSTTVVWRTNVTRAEIYHTVSPEATSWSWTVYKGQPAVEQNAWVQMFMGDLANFSLPNLRAGIDVIFGAASAQTTHCKAVGKRLCSEMEKLFATGTGTLASPATMAFEGTLTAQQISDLYGAG